MELSVESSVTNEIKMMPLCEAISYLWESRDDPALCDNVRRGDKYLLSLADIVLDSMGRGSLLVPPFWERLLKMSFEGSSVYSKFKMFPKGDPWVQDAREYGLKRDQEVDWYYKSHVEIPVHLGRVRSVFAICKPDILKDLRRDQDGDFLSISGRRFVSWISSAKEVYWGRLVSDHYLSTTVGRVSDHYISDHALEHLLSYLANRPEEPKVTDFEVCFGTDS
jgi:hypothetical protein